MKRTILIGIDIGTQGTKAALFDRRGRTLAAAIRKSRLHQPEAGVVEWTDLNPATGKRFYRVVTLTP